MSTMLLQPLRSGDCILVKDFAWGALLLYILRRGSFGPADKVDTTVDCLTKGLLKVHGRSVSHPGPIEASS